MKFLLCSLTRHRWVDLPRFKDDPLPDVQCQRCCCYMDIEMGSPYSVWEWIWLRWSTSRVGSWLQGYLSPNDPPPF